MLQTLKPFLAPTVNAVRLLLGVLQYRLTGRTPAWAYQSLIAAFCRNGGRTNDLLSGALAIVYRPQPRGDTRGLLGPLDRDHLGSIARRIETDGYFVVRDAVPLEVCDRLIEFALTSPCVLRGSSGPRAAAPRRVARYEREQPAGVRYDFETQDVIDNGDVQDLMADASLVSLAQHYLRAEPIFDVMSMWWHTAFSSQPDKDAAQFWHFDMDRIKWLKVFIYLTDVDATNGPHSFVRGSHRTNGIPPSLLTKGYARLNDDEVESHFGRDRIVEFTAPRGTVIVEDTRGLHKGKHVQHADRLVLQLQLSNSLFGGDYPPAKFGQIVSPRLEAQIRRHPRTYSAYA